MSRLLKGLCSMLVVSAKARASTDSMLNEQMLKLLKTRIGCYQLFEYFINVFISYRLFEGNQEAKEALTSEESMQKRKVSQILKSVIPTYINIKKNQRKIKKQDIAFLCIYRTKVALGKSPAQSDYLFDNVLEHLTPQHKCALVVTQFNERYSNDSCDNYNVVTDCISLSIIVRSLALITLVYVRFLVARRALSHANRERAGFIFTPRRLLPFCLTALCLEKFVKTARPKALVVNDDAGYRTRPIDIDAKVIIVQSAQLVDDLEFHRGTLNSKCLAFDRKADFFAVSGPFFEKLLERYYLQSKNTKVTGQPRFDELIRMQRHSRLANNGEGGYTKKKVVLWATATHGYSHEENMSNVQAVYGALKRIPDLKLFIKLHPAESRNQFYYKTLQEAPFETKVFSNADLVGLLSQCDALIVRDSTVAIEAAILGKNIIVMNLSGYPDSVDYVSSGIAVGVYERQDLEGAIRRALYDANTQKKLALAREKYLYDHTYLQDGKAAERLADVIKQTLKSRP